MACLIYPLSRFVPSRSLLSLISPPLPLPNPSPTLCISHLALHSPSVLLPLAFLSAPCLPLSLCGFSPLYLSLSSLLRSPLLSCLSLLPASSLAPSVVITSLLFYDHISGFSSLPGSSLRSFPLLGLLAFLRLALSGSPFHSFWPSHLSFSPFPFSFSPPPLH